MKPHRTILVTGGAGFIGSHVAEAYVRDGHRVLVVDDLSSGRRENLPEAVEFHQLDIRSPEAARLLVDEGVEILNHHAAQMDVRRSTADPAFDAEVNILGLLNLLEGCVEAGTRQVVFASTGGAIYGEQESYPADESHPTRPLSPYGISKLAGERYLFYYSQRHDLGATCLRYANVYGERQNPHGEAGVVAIFTRSLLAGEQPVINGDGLQTRDYVHVSDVVRANRAVTGGDTFEIFNVGTGVETSVVALYSAIRDAVGSEVEAAHGPAKPGEQRRSSVDASRLARQMNGPGPLPLAEGIARTVAWFERRRASET